MDIVKNPNGMNGELQQIANQPEVNPNADLDAAQIAEFADMSPEELQDSLGLSQEEIAEIKESREYLDTETKRVDQQLLSNEEIDKQNAHNVTDQVWYKPLTTWQKHPSEKNLNLLLMSMGAKDSAHLLELMRDNHDSIFESLPRKARIEKLKLVNRACQVIKSGMFLTIPIASIALGSPLMLLPLTIAYIKTKDMIAEAQKDVKEKIDKAQKEQSLSDDAAQSVDYYLSASEDIAKRIANVQSPEEQREILTELENLQSEMLRAAEAQQKASINITNTERYERSVQKAIAEMSAQGQNVSQESVKKIQDKKYEEIFGVKKDVEKDKLIGGRTMDEIFKMGKHSDTASAVGENTIPIYDPTRKNASAEDYLNSLAKAS